MCSRFADVETGSSNVHDSEGRYENLRFPPFHRAIMSETHWDATEDLGRIKIELSQGYQVERDGKVIFHKHSNVVCYSFQPAPLGMYIERHDGAFTDIPQSSSSGLA